MLNKEIKKQINFKELKGAKLYLASKVEGIELEQDQKIIYSEDGKTALVYKESFIDSLMDLREKDTYQIQYLTRNSMDIDRIFKSGFGYTVMDLNYDHPYELVQFDINPIRGCHLFTSKEQLETNGSTAIYNMIGFALHKGSDQFKKTNRYLVFYKTEKGE